MGMKRLAQGAITTGGGTLYSTSLMVKSFVRKICAICQLFGIKCSNVFGFATNFYSCPPPIPSSNNSKESAFICFCWYSSVLKVYAPSNIPKVAYPIIRWITIYVVNMIFRPISMNIKPSESMFPNSLSKYTNKPITIRVKSSTSDVFALIPSPSYGEEKPTLSVIQKYRLELFYCKIDFAHAIRSLKAIVGEVMQGVCRPFALRHYSMR